MSGWADCHNKWLVPEGVSVNTYLLLTAGKILSCNPGNFINILRPEQKWTPFSRWRIEINFPVMKIQVIWFKFHWNTSIGVELPCPRVGQHNGLAAEEATSHYLNQWWSSPLIHICDIEVETKWPTFLQMTFFNWFPSNIFFIFWFKSHRHLFPCVQLTICQYCGLDNGLAPDLDEL